MSPVILVVARSLYVNRPSETRRETNEFETSSAILEDIRRLLLQINDRSDYILAALHKTRTEIAREGIDWPAQISIVQTIDLANSNNANVLQILHSRFGDLALSELGLLIERMQLKLTSGRKKQSTLEIA
jgi:hypothetical protein